MNKLFWPLLLALLFTASAAFAGDFVIVPGQRIGTISLGEDCALVWAVLHSPDTEQRTRGFVIDTWLSHAPLPASAAEHGNYLKHDYLTVFFRGGHAVQIEVSAAKFKTASSLSTHSSGSDFVKHYPNYQTPHFAGDPRIHYHDQHYGVTEDPDGASPAFKHFLAYGDAVRQGIAWKCGAWGDLAPDPDQNGPLEAVIVHIPGNAVLLNPNDGLPYSGTGPARK